jgi:superoxide dismutase, Cu-Zn family
MDLIMKTILATLFVLSIMAAAAFAEEMVVTINLVSENGVGGSVGTIKVTDTEHGVLFTPQLSRLKPGLHGFHVHENPSCDCSMKEGKMTAANAAGSHLDPAKTGKHEGPYGAGHLGDLPPLYVAADGSCTLPVLAPRLKVSDLKNRALMIHDGADNYADTPAALGGGGARIACGVVK